MTQKNLVEELTEDEQNFIISYIDENAAGKGYDPDPDRREEDLNVLLKYWSNAKSRYLFNLLGEKLILKKPISYTTSTDEIRLQIEERLNCVYSEMALFQSNFKDFILTIKPKNLDTYDKLFAFIDAETLAINIAPETFNIILPDDSIFHVVRGEKITKILGKLAKRYSIPGYENFRIKHSQFLSARQLYGNFCLSIHPLDFMTMSDNDNDWDTCMSWRKPGEYRGGSIEIMNSPMVLMAYLESKKEFKTSDIVWNNKKWRELFIITKDIITEIKGYPFQSSYLTEEALNWIYDLAGKNLNWSFDNETKQNVKGRSCSDIEIKFETSQVMYNDFGTLPYHLCKIGALKSRNHNKLCVDYSGFCECIWCGQSMLDEAIRQPDRLCCSDCAPTIRCFYCGEYININECYYIDDEPVCEYCIQEKCVLDDTTQEYIDIDYATEIYLIKDEDDSGYIDSDDNHCLTLTVAKDLLDDKEQLKQYFVYGKDSLKKGKTGWGHSCKYIDYSNLTPKGAEIFCNSLGEYPSRSEALNVLSWYLNK